MAQKKLLFSLILALASSASTIFAANGVGAITTREDQVWVQNLTQNAASLAFNEIRQKYIELQNMLSKNDGHINFGKIEEQILTPNQTLRVFVSSSMSPGLLKNYLDEAKKYNAVLVLKGLPGGSWQRLSKLVTEITGGSDEGVAIQIDDEAFDHFGIKSVPGFVLSQSEGRWIGEETPELFDKVTGNIGIRGALGLIAAQGELKSIAKQMLQQAGGVR